MKVTITSLLGDKQKFVKNTMDITNRYELDMMIRSVVTDRSATLSRSDGLTTEVVYCGTVRDEVYNNKDLLVQWINMEVDEFPPGGEYKKASV